MSDDPGKQKLDELVAGLDGVTTGPWEQKSFPMDEWVGTKDCAIAGCNAWHGPSHRRPSHSEVLANAAHIARCDPETIRSISDAYKAMERERDALRREAEELVVAQYRISALEAAISRQVENIERWMETGKAAGPEESKSIYEQMKAALAHTTGQEGGR